MEGLLYSRWKILRAREELKKNDEVIPASLRKSLDSTMKSLTSLCVSVYDSEQIWTYKTLGKNLTSGGLTSPTHRTTLLKLASRQSLYLTREWFAML